MRVDFVRAELRHLDEVGAEALALPLFADERPLRGAAGLVDWRLNGRLSHWLSVGRFRAAPGEMLLYPVRGRLPFDRLLLFGLGAAGDFGEAGLPGVNGALLRALRDIGVQRFAGPLPGRRALSLDIRKQVEYWLQAARDVFLDEPPGGREPELLIIDDSETQRATAETVGTFLRRLRVNRG